MAGRVQQDTFIDDSDETCPLCVEEFDLSDRHFRPCPCGYQVCQFCFNNIKNNMNGLCPACRRPYNEKTIEWKVVSPEEFKADIQKQARKKAEMRQKEAQKREVESQNRKHLSGLRVVQKNLVYVVGLNPRIREEDLLSTLRGEQYFGQYGKIVKIVVSKAKDGGHGNQPLGVYVTFARVQDAEKCIAAVDGSENGGRTLRAQFGTTKYCSAYLRNEQCMNKSCMFLHEPGEEKDSFTRQDLSSINVVSTQRPAASDAAGPSGTSGGDSRAAEAHVSAPAQRGPHAVAAATQPMARMPSKEGTISPVDSGDGSALPSSASWANRGLQQQQSRRTSQSVSASSPSPVVGGAALASLGRPFGRIDSNAASNVRGPESQMNLQLSQRAASSHQPSSYDIMHGLAGPRPDMTSMFNDLIANVSSPDFCFSMDRTMFSPEEYESIMNYPCLIDPSGGAKRRAMREQDEREIRERAQDPLAGLRATPDAVGEDMAGSGSLQLGGEPEEGHGGSEHGRRGEMPAVSAQEPRGRTIQPPSQPGMGAAISGAGFGPMQGAEMSSHGRSFTPSQQTSYGVLEGGEAQGGSFLDQLPQSFLPQAPSSQTGLFQNPLQQLTPQGHARQSSRFSFANDSSSASAAVKPAINVKLMAQQSAMMPSTASSASGPSQHQPPHGFGGPYHAGPTQGPPPGLKSVGTPPVSGGGMFSQGHGFTAGAAGVGSSLSRGTSAMDDKNELLRDMFRPRGGAGGPSGAAGGQTSEAGKREYMFPSFLQQHPTSTNTTAATTTATVASTPAPGLLGSLYGAPAAGVYPDPSASKQPKKKGKKHRHANTSSSGGGGIVNLADPSILQARVNQPAGTASGQGYFGGSGASGVAGGAAAGQGQDSNFSHGPSSEAAHAIGPNIFEPTTFHPKTIPASTGDGGAARSPIQPAIPIRAGPAPSHPLPSWVPTGPARQHRRLPSVEEIPPESTGSKGNGQAVDTVPPLGPTTGQRRDRPPAQPERLPAQPETSRRSQEDRPKASHLEKLNIAAAKQEMAEPPSSSAMSKPESADRTSQPRSSAPPAPATFDTEFPSLRPPQHKTLRVVAAPHAEAMSSTSTSSTAVPSPVAQLPSRKPSQASLTRPATPASELISDNASITSTSISQSRASSPPPPMPPAVVGSAPVRQTTKNQQKKQRKESKKEQEKSLITAPAEEKEIGPIVGRKKKQKTRVVSTQAEDSAPSASRPVSPGKETNLEEAETTITTEPEAVEASPVVASPVEARPVEAALAVTSPNDPSPAEPTSAEAKTLAKGKGKAALSQPPSDKAAPSDVGPVENAAAPYTGPYAFPQPPTMKSILNSTRSANLLVSDLVKRGDLDPSTHSFFNPSVGANQRFDFTDEDFADMESKVKLTTQDQMALAQGRAVRLVHPEDGTSSNAVVTPGGCFLRGLSDEKEDRFLELEQQIADTPEATKYTPARHVGENSFFMVGGRVVQSGPGAMVGASAGTQAVDGTYLWTSSKMRIDEALNYINQFVLPALPKGSGSGNGRGPGPGAKTNPANTDTGRAPDPSSYTQYIIPGTGSSTASPSTSNMTANFTADVAGVMHYMASGSTSRLDPSPPLGTVDELSMTAQAYPRQPSLQLMQEASGADADADADGDEDGEGFTSDLPQNVPLLTAFEAETAMINARRELEGLEKKLSALVKRNRKGVTTAAGVE